MSEVAIETSNSVHPDSTFLIRSSPPTKSAPDSLAIVADSPSTKTATTGVLPTP